MGRRGMMSRQDCPCSVDAVARVEAITVRLIIICEATNESIGSGNLLFIGHPSIHPRTHSSICTFAARTKDCNMRRTM